MFRHVLACLLAALCAVTTGALAQSPSADTGAVFGRTTGGFIALSVSDLNATAKWYEEKLGMRRIMTVGRMERIVGVIALESDGLIVEMIQRDDARERSSLPELTRGIAKAGVIVTDFDRVVAALRARGIQLLNGPYPARQNARANVAFTDNEGNMIQIFGGYAK